MFSTNKSVPALANAKDAFYASLEEARNPAHLYNGPAYIGLLRLMTMHGKVPFQHGLASMMIREAAIVQALMGRDDIMMVQPDSQEIATCNVLVAHSAFGKVSLYQHSEHFPEGETFLGGLKIEDTLLDVIENTCVIEDFLEKQEQQRIDALLYNWEVCGSLKQKVSQVIDWVEREESVYIYIGRRTFARSDAGGNTLNSKPNGILRNLLEDPLSAWQREERLFIVAMQLLFLTGSAIRFEEFNGRQLTAVELRKWLLHKVWTYNAVLGEEAPQDTLSLPLWTLAENIGRLARRVDRSGWTRYRRVEGITFCKQEKLISPQNFSQAIVSLPSLITDIASHLALELPDTGEPCQTLVEITKAALRFYRETGSSEYIHQIIEGIVLSAVIQSEADYGMSSSIRTPDLLKGTPEQRISGVLDLAKTNFYCCVLPHPGLLARLPEQTLFHTLYSSALRMEFNRWHFVPGNFSREEIPLNRHYYFPPLMPDIAEWADLRHGGHTKAGVRYSIRAPGAPLWREPFIAYHHQYRGCYDVRVVRREGPPLGMRELQVATSHCTLMDIFWKTMQQFIEEYNIVTPVVTAYTREWYENAEWMHAVGRASMP